MRSKILSIEDDPTMQLLIEGSLADYQVVQARSIKEAEALLPTGDFEAVLLDIELPDGDGLKFYAKLSHDQKLKSIPVLVLSGHAEISNKLVAFSIGAEDFIAKPFDPLELSARVHSKIQKRRQGATEKRLRRVGDLEIDFDRQRAFRMESGQEKDLQLTGIELRILSLLSRRIDQVYSREQILSEIWGQTHITDRTVDSHIAHLRQKIENSKVSISTVKNFGYRLNLGA
jgi:DNA-binding response OmpR family regulator